MRLNYDDEEVTGANPEGFATYVRMPLNSHRTLTLKICNRLTMKGKKIYESYTIPEAATWRDCQQLLNSAVAFHVSQSEIELPPDQGWCYQKIGVRGLILSDFTALTVNTFPHMMQYLIAGGVKILLDHDRMHQECIQRKVTYKKVKNWRNHSRGRPYLASRWPLETEEEEVVLRDMRYEEMSVSWDPPEDYYDDDMP